MSVTDKQIDRQTVRQADIVDT